MRRKPTVLRTLDWRHWSKAQDRERSGVRCWSKPAKKRKNRPADGAVHLVWPASVAGAPVLLEYRGWQPPAAGDLDAIGGRPGTDRFEVDSRAGLPVRRCQRFLCDAVLGKGTYRLASLQRDVRTFPVETRAKPRANTVSRVLTGRRRNLDVVPDSIIRKGRMNYSWDTHAYQQSNKTSPPSATARPRGW
jgi:hypothetical protein